MAEAPGAIRGWLEGLGLGQHAEAFEAQEIDLDALADVTEGDLKEMGIPIGPRRKILRAIAELGTAAQTAPAPARPQEAERRQITVMFCDLVGSTALSEKLDPEDLRSLMQDYQKACGGVIERYEGHVAQYLGDGLMTYFGWPRAHEDDAERAVRASLEIVEAVGTMELQVRIGVATGPVVVGETGAGDASVPKLAVGETPNLAARLQGLASADEIVVGPSTRRLLGGTFELDDLGEQALKGIVEPVPAHRVTGIAATEGRFEAQHQYLTPLVGREAEMAMVMARWEQACAGEGQVIVLGGEPGIGKSRITQAFRERVEDEPHTRLRYQCSPYHTNSALHPVIEQIERAAGFTRDDEPDNKLNKLDKLEQLIPNGAGRALIASLLSLPVERYAALAMSPQKQKEETLRMLAEQVTALAADTPVLLIFEDAHWIDPTSQELLDLVVPMVAAHRVLAVITHRPEYTPPWTGRGHVAPLALTRLGRAEAAAMVARVSDKPLPDDVLDQIVAKTDGVPLFVEELTKTVVEGGIQTADSIPETLQDSLMARLDRLMTVKDVAQTAACIGREFSQELIVAVSPLDTAALEDAIQQLVTAELIFRADANYVFKHALVQDAAYNSLLRSKRQQIHGVIAEALQDLFSDIRDIEPELVAQHYTEAGSGSDAISWWIAAGKIAIERMAMVEALAHLERALAINESLSPNSRNDRQELEIRNALGVAHTAVNGWASEKIFESLSPAVSIAKRLNDSEALLPLLWGLALKDTCQANFDTAHGWISNMVMDTQSDPISSLAITGHSMGSGLYFMKGDNALARYHGDRAIAEYDPDRHGSVVSVINHDPRIFALLWESHFLWALGYPDQAARASDDALEYAHELDHVFMRGMALTTACGAYIYRREPEMVLRRTEEALVLAREHDLPIFEFTAREWGCWALLQAGRAREAYEAAKQAADEWEAMQGRIQVPFMRSVMSLALAEMGEVEDAVAAMGDALAYIEDTNERWFEAETNRISGELLLILPDPCLEEGERCFRKAVEVAQGQSNKGWELRAATSLARLWQSQGKSREAHDLLAPVYGWFTEGFDTADLKEAKALLQALEAA